MSEDFSLTEGHIPTKPNVDQIIGILIKRKIKKIGIMILIYMISYVGLMILAGFSRPFLSHLAFGSVNIGFVLIAANYLLSWALAFIYVKIANSFFDPLVARAITAFKTNEGV